MNDNRLVKSVIISKNDVFYFSMKYDENEVKPYISKAHELYLILSEIPIFPDIFSGLKEENRKQAIHGTAALEGNPLSMEEVDKILSEKDKKKSDDKHRREIENLRDADTYLGTIINAVETPYILKEKDILQFHRIIMDGIEERKTRPGKYRIHKVKVGDKEHGGIYVPPQTKKDIELLMSEFIIFINDDKILTLDPVIRAAAAHFHLGRIHPFEDGNGRVARYIEALLLKTSGLKYFPTALSVFYNQNKDDYYWAFSLSGKNKNKEITAFAAFVYACISDCLLTIKDRVRQSVRIVTLKDYYSTLRNKKAITQRQLDFLNILLLSDNVLISTLSNKPPFDILYRDVTARTRDRDIIKLKEMNLIVVNENKEVSINMKALDLE